MHVNKNNEQFLKVETFSVIGNSSAEVDNLRVLHPLLLGIMIVCILLLNLIHLHLLLLGWC